MKKYYTLFVIICLSISLLISYKVYNNVRETKKNLIHIVGIWKDKRENGYYLSFTQDGYQEVIFDKEKNISEIKKGNYVIKRNIIKLEKQEYTIISLNNTKLLISKRDKNKMSYYEYLKIEKEEW